jgi:DNA-binding transcriptional ArsR family regulator
MVKVMSEERAAYIAGTLSDEPIEQVADVEYRDPIKELGWAKIEHIITLDTDLSDGAYRTYAMLLYYWQRKNTTWVGVDTLADVRGVTESTIRKHIAELKDAGLISRQRRMGKSSLTYIEDLPEKYSDDAEKILTNRRKNRGKSAENSAVSPPKKSRSGNSKKPYENRDEVHENGQGMRTIEGEPKNDNHFPPTAETLVEQNNACSQIATPPQSKIGVIAGSDYNDVGNGNGHSGQTRSAVATRIEHPFRLQEKDLAAQVRANAEFDAMPSASVGMPPRKTNNASIASPIAWRGNGAVDRVARELELLVGSSHKCTVAAKRILAEMQDEARLIAVIQEMARDEKQAAFAQKAGAMPMVNTVLHQCKQRAQALIQTHSRGRGFIAPVMVE